MLRREIAIVEALCRRAEAAGGSRPTTPKPIRAVLNERMKRYSLPLRLPFKVGEGRRRDKP